jgi:hypothetical protein
MTALSKIRKILFGNLFREKFADRLRYKKLQFSSKKEYLDRQRRVPAQSCCLEPVADNR